jgi:hypothetical protein
MGTHQINTKMGYLRSYFTRLHYPNTFGYSGRYPLDGLLGRYRVNLFTQKKQSGRYWVIKIPVPVPKTRVKSARVKIG